MISLRDVGIPHAPEAERAIVTAFVYPGNVCFLQTARQLISPADFYDPANVKLFKAIGAVADAGQRVDKVSIAEALRHAGNLEAVGAESIRVDFDLIVDEARIREWAISIRETARKRRIYRAAQQMSRAALNGATADELLAQFQTDIADCATHTQPYDTVVAARPQARLVTFDELDSMPLEDRDCLVEGLLVAGGTSLIVAKPKVGKTVTLQNLAFAVAHGESFLGRQTTQGPVVYIALEDKPSYIRDNFRKMGVRNGGNLLFWIGPSPENAIAWLAEKLAECRPALIVVDPLQRLLHLSDTNDYAKVSNATEPLIHLARRSGAHLALAHHAGKGDNYMGSTAFFGAVDTMLQLRKNADGRRSIRSEQRYGNDLEETVIELDRATTLIVPKGTIVDVERGMVCQKITEMLESAGRWIKHAELVEAIEARRELIGAVLYSLMASNEIQRIGSGKKGSPFQYAMPSIPPPLYSPDPQPDYVEAPARPSCEPCVNPIPNISRESKDDIYETTPEAAGVDVYPIPSDALLHDDPDVAAGDASNGPKCV